MFFREQYKSIPLVYNLVLAMLWRHPENVQLEKVKVVLRDRSHGGSRAKRRTWIGRCGRRGRTSGSRLERRKAADEGDVAGGDGPRGSRFERRKSAGEGAAAGGDGRRRGGAWRRSRSEEGQSLAGTDARGAEPGGGVARRRGGAWRREESRGGRRR